MAVTVGSKTILALPGEPFVEIGLELQQSGQDGHPDVIVVGYVNDYPGYVVTPSDYAENRYETIATPLAESGATAIVQAARDLKSSVVGAGRD